MNWHNNEINQLNGDYMITSAQKNRRPKGQCLYFVELFVNTSYVSEYIRFNFRDIFECAMESLKLIRALMGFTCNEMNARKYIPQHKKRLQNLQQYYLPPNYVCITFKYSKLRWQPDS